MKSSRGFTIVEILVTVSVMAILSSILVIYNRTSERQLILFKEQARLVSALNQAKNLAMNLFREPPAGPIPCGYGVTFSFASSSYMVFEDLPPAGGCDESNNQYNSGENFGDIIYTDKAIEIDQSSSSLEEVFFIPPDPKVILNRDVSITEEKIIVLKIKGTNNKKVIKINKAGQITAE